MRLLVSFAAAVVVALALFALMLILVMPPRDETVPVEELARVSFVRSVSDTQSESRERQQQEAPERPQPPDQPPVQPTPPQPQVSANMDLNISVPSVPTQIQVSSAPSLQGLTAAQVETSPQPTAPPPDSSPSVSEEVTPLTDVPPNYPQRALASGIEGEVTLAFTITADGRVENLRVTDAQPPGVFDREARRAASRWRFAPRRENGQAVAREATKTLYFRLDGGR